MIFKPETYCAPAEAFSLQFNMGALGREGALAVASVALGKCFILGGDNVLAAEAGDIAIIPHMASVSSVDGCTLEGIYLVGRVPADIAAAMGSPLLLQGKRPGVEAMLRRLMEESKLMHPGEAGGLAYMLLCRIEGAQHATGQVSALVAAAAQIMNEAYGELYGVAELAEELMVSKHHLIRRFTVEMGISPGKYLASVRVENAKRLLLHQGLTLEVVAGMCGFSGANYMCKVFKQHTGETPAGWRAGAACAVPLRPVGRLEEQAFL